MTFDEMFEAVEIGASVKVSNGLPPPTNIQGLPYKAWRSHNFAGVLIEKIDGEYRSARFEMSCPLLAPDAVGYAVQFTISEGYGHAFTIV
jgi:hypothetical protein